MPTNDDTKDKARDKAEDLVEEAKQDEGETPNRDEDEFAKDHLKQPKVDPETQELGDDE